MVQTMTLPEKYKFLIEYFQKNNPNAASELHFLNAYELVLAVVLSAQCTDKRVNMITPALFAKFPESVAPTAFPPLTE